MASADRQSPPALRRGRILVPALLLSIFCLLGVFWSLRAGMSYTFYYQAKYGKLTENRPTNGPAREQALEKIFNLCERAHGLYPKNFHLCIFAAETAYYERFNDDGTENETRLALARTWCDRGLALNPYKSQLRLLDVRLVGRDDPARAVSLWSTFLDWQFWEPFNHRIMVELLARSGRYAEALSQLKWVEGSKYYREARQSIAEALEEDEKRTQEFLQSSGS